ncbi:hypothetical protein [Microbacterium sp. NPDC080220]|uniref:hypothetical protein n=1 Tax=Microbacterium sp. NPDC080220 TaxID=3161017 RepID=UPI003418F5B2
MAREERAAWVGLVVSLIAIAVYAAVVAGRAASTPLPEVDWLGPMLWTIIGGIVVSIVVTIIWGVVAEGGSLRGENAADERDRAITQMGDRVGVAFLVIGGVVGIALCAIDAAPFWIANTLYAGLALSSVVGGIARVVAYRRGLV